MAQIAKAVAAPMLRLKQHRHWLQKWLGTLLITIMMILNAFLELISAKALKRANTILQDK